jgi:hypothetical protein
MGDPILLNAFLASYKIWRGDVDKLYVNMGGCLSEELAQYCINEVEKVGGKAWYHHGGGIQHGDSIRFLLENCEEDHVVLCEDDAWILQPEVLSRCFVPIETGDCDIIGSTRGCIEPEVMEACYNKFNLRGSSPEHGLKDCSSLWPCFLFAHKDKLLATDRDFNAKHWQPGEVIPYIDYPCTKHIIGDTFVWATIQLRGLGNTVKYVHQRHCSNEDKTARSRLFTEPALPWVHFGSLSSLLNGLVKDENLVPIGRLSAGSLVDRPIPYPEIPDNTKAEMERRVSIAALMAEHFPIKDPDLKYFSDAYRAGVDRAIDGCKLDRVSVNLFKRSYTRLLHRLFHV